jgi:hypothetical protein
LVKWKSRSLPAGETKLTDQQLLTLAIAVIMPLSMLLYSNSRITETKETLRADIKALSNRLEGLQETLRAEMALGLERNMTAIKGLETKLTIHELEHHSK